MLNLTDINETIEQLEQGPTTFEVCNKLATLYTVRNEFSTRTANEVVLELSDILPQYRRYCGLKQKYQMQEISIDAVLSSMDMLCTEIEEFIDTLYSHTDTEEERDKIKTLMNKLYNDLEAQ